MDRQTDKAILIRLFILIKNICIYPLGSGYKKKIPLAVRTEQFNK